MKENLSWEPASKCSRTVTKSIYEQTNPETRKWWKRMFQIMEEDLKIPPHRRPEILSQIYPKKLLERILDIVESKTDLKHKVKDYYPQKSSESLYSSDYVKHFGQGESCTSIVVGQLKEEKKIEVEEEEEEDEVLGEDFIDDLETLVSSAGRPSTAVEKVQVKEAPIEVESSKESFPSLPCKFHIPRSIDEEDGPGVIGEENPYLNFFLRKEERAAIWRILPPLSLDEMNLAQKAKYLVNQIAEEFIEWLEKEGGTEMIHLDVPTLLNMFQFSFEIGHAAHSLQVRIREMASVSEQVAISNKLPKRSHRRTVLRYIKQDIRKSKLPPRQIAFGRTLPVQMRRSPVKEDLYHKWFVCKHVPPKLADMAMVWEGITHLRSVRTFCKWLMEQEMQVLPKYLKDQGLLNESYYKDRESVESYTSLGPTELPPTFRLRVSEDSG